MQCSRETEQDKVGCACDLFTCEKNICLLSVVCAPEMLAVCTQLLKPTK